MSLSREEYHGTVSKVTASQVTVPSTDVASLRLGRLVSDTGASGIVYQLIGDARLYKRYRLPVGARHAQRLRELIAWRETLDGRSQEILDRHSAWPQELITRDGDVAGFLMARAPGEFWCHGVDEGTEVRLVRDLAMYLSPGPASPSGPAPSLGQRLALARDLASFLDLLDRYQMVYGDLGPLNVLWTVHPQPGVYVIDCDNARPADFAPEESGIAVARQAGAWADPRPAPHGSPTIDSDRYALAYFFGRVACQFEPPNPALLGPDGVPPFDQWPGRPAGLRRFGELERYLAEGLYGAQERRPSAHDWVQAIDRVDKRGLDVDHTLAYDRPLTGKRRPRPVPAGRRRLDSWLLTGCVACAVGGLALGLGVRPLIWPDAARRPAPSSTPTPARKPVLAAPAVHVTKPAPGRPSGQALDVSDEDSVQAIAVSGDGTRLATGDADHATYLWNAAGLPDSGAFDSVPLRDDDAEGTSASQGVNAVAFNAGGTVVAAGDRNGYAYVWSASDNGQPSYTVHDYGTDNGGVHGVAFSSDGTLATGDGDGDVYLWGSGGTSPCAPQQCTARDPENQGASPEVLAVAFSPQGSLLAAADHDGGVYLWNEASVLTGAARQPSVSLTVPDGEAVQAVAFSHDGKYLAAGDADGNTYVWSTGNWQLVRTVTDSATATTTVESGDGEAGVTSLAFSADDLVLATGDVNGGVYLWNLTSGARIARLSDPQTYGVNAVAFSPGGTFLLAADGDGSVYRWPMSWLSY
jgi:WD40 repeat protein